MSSEGKSKDSDKSKAREAFANLVANLWNEERTSYEESYELEDADNIPMEQLEEHSYKDLRVMDMYFSDDDSDKAMEGDMGKDEEAEAEDITYTPTGITIELKNEVFPIFFKPLAGQPYNR